MALVADTFNRTNTSLGTMGSTDTGSLAWQGATNWQINSNAAKNVESAGVCWVITPNSDAEVGIETGASTTHGNGVGAAFWVEDASNYWISYVHGERYQDGTTCVGGYYSCQSCTACGGGNKNPVVYNSGETTNYTQTVGCGCSTNVHAACGCDIFGNPYRAEGDVTEIAWVCGDANCSQRVGNNAETCVSYFNTNAYSYNAPTGGNANYSYNAPTGGNAKYSYNAPKTNYSYNSPSFKGNKYRDNGNIVSYSPVPGNLKSSTTPGNSFLSSYNAISPGNSKVANYNATVAGNLKGGNQNPTVYNCSPGNYTTGSCTTGACSPTSGTYACGNITCASADKTCTSCGTTGKQYSRTCTCTKSGGNTNACGTCVPTSGAECYNACLENSPNYKFRYKLKVDRIAAGTRSNHYTSAALYDSTSSTQSWGSIKVVTSGADYTAYVYTDDAWTTEAANSGLQASGQSDYLSSVGHGIGVAPLGDQNPGETDQIDYWYASYSTGSDSVGILIS
jgi:hypothetical protein